MAGNNGASQFSAFAALTGFEDLIEEHNQIYEARREPSEEELQILSEKNKPSTQRLRTHTHILQQRKI